MHTAPMATMSALQAEQRPVMAFLMASLLCSYPDTRCVYGLHTLLDDEQLDVSCAVADSADWPGLRQRLEAVLASAVALETLRSEYTAIFDYGREHASLYETEYGRGSALVKGHALADIAGFYRAFGLEFGYQDRTPEMLDHVAVELEFYALLLMKQEALAASGDAVGGGIVQEARQKFLDAHLGRFVGAIAQRPAVTASAFYGPLLAWCRDLVAEECVQLDISPVPVDGLDTRAEPEEMGCGGTCSLLGGNRLPSQPC